MNIIPEGASVGIPESISIGDIGVIEKLKERGNTVSYHEDTSLSPRRKNEIDTDIYLTSSNALTQDVNIDATGNRVSGMAWGINKIIFGVGINKLTDDLESAIQRVRD